MVTIFISFLGGFMKDKDFEKLINSGDKRKAKISDRKIAGDIKNVFYVFSDKKQNAEKYIQVANELVYRLKKRGLTDFSLISYDDLTDLEKNAVRMIRNDATLNTEILKGDSVISTFLMIETLINKRRSNKLTPKKMQVTDYQIQKIFELKQKGMSISKISNNLSISRFTISRVLKKDYISKDDVAKILKIEKNVKSDSGL